MNDVYREVVNTDVPLQTKESPNNDVHKFNNGISINPDQGTYTVGGADGLSTGQKQVHHAYDVSQLVGEGQSGLMASVEAPWGGPVVGPVTPNCTVKVQGMRTAVAVAQSMGLIKQDANGNYIEASSQTQHSSDSQQTTESDSQGIAFKDSVVEGNLAEIGGALGDEMAGSMVEDVISGRLNMDNYANQLGVDVESFSKATSEIISAFQSQADSAIQAEGIDPYDLYEWCAENDSETLQRVMREHAHSRNPNVWAELAQAYKRATVPISVEDIPSQFKPRIVGDRVLVTVDGIETDLETATSLGYL